MSGSIPVRRWVGILLAWSLIGVPAISPREATAQTIHWISVGDTNDPRIGPYCSRDLAEVGLLCYYNIPMNRLRLKEIQGGQVKRQVILGAIAELRIQPNDTVVFYYSGHGAMDQDRRHYIALPGGSPLYRADVRGAIAAKAPRLTVLLTDICSVMVPVRPRTFAVEAKPPPAEVTPLFTALLIEPRGVVDVNGSSPGEVGLCDPGKERGGLFTMALRDVLGADPTTRLSWPQALGLIRKNVGEYFKAGWPAGYDLARDGLAGVQATQTPYAIELPGGAGRPVVLGAAVLATADGNGVAVVRVEPNTPASRSRLEPRDVILEMNGRPIRSTADYLAAIRESGPVLHLAVRNWRDGRRVEFDAQLDPGAGAAAIQPALSAPGAVRFGAVCVDTDGRGARIIQVMPATPAASAGMEPNDIITAINGTAVRNAREYGDALARSGPVAGFVIRNRRNGQLVSFSARLSNAAP